MKKLRPLPFSLLLCLFSVLPLPSTLTAQDTDPDAEQPSFFERFVDIFKSPSPIVLEPEDSTAVGNRKEVDVTKQYWRIYNLIHQEQQAQYQSLVDSSYTRWDELTDLSEAKSISPDADTIRIASNVKVFGWHPHWMGSAYQFYRFKLMSHVSLFSYNVNTGAGLPYDNPEVIKAWESEDFQLIPLAHEAGCNVMLTVTNFGAKKNRIFLTDTDRQDKLIEDVVTRMSALGADGIDLDFEMIPQNYEKQLSEFIIKLRKRLDTEYKGQKEQKSYKQDQGYQLSVVLPKVNGSAKDNRIYNIKILQEYVDFFTITAYDFTTGDYQAGPIAPLYNSDRKRRAFGSIEDVVFNYLEDGLEREKLLVGLPFYGGKWTRHSRAAGKDSTQFQHLTYAGIMKSNRRKGPPEYIANVWAAKYAEEGVSELEGYDTKTSVTWFDDSITLSKKYDWVLDQKLGGIGIWALGYDLPREDMWGLIGDKFTPVNDVLVRRAASQSIWSVPHTLLKYSDLFGISGLFIFAFMAIGFVVALFDWRVREVFFQKKTLRLLYIVAAFAIVTATIAILLFLQPQLIEQFGLGWLLIITLLFGLVSGVWLVRLISKWFTKQREATP